MKRILAVICSLCLVIGTVGCGKNKDNINPTAEASVDTQTELEDSNTETEVTKEENGMTIEEYGELMTDLSQFSTSTEHDTDKSFVTIEFGDYSAEVAFQNVDSKPLNDLISRGEAGITEESEDATQILYETDGGSRWIMDYNTGKQEWYIDTINDTYSSILRVNTWKDNLYECSVYTSSPDLCADPESIKIDGLDLNATVQDVIDTYGVPTEARASQSYRTNVYSVVYTWDAFNNFNGNLRAEFDIIETDNGFDLMLSQIGFTN